MPDVVGVRFKSCGKIYDFEINGIDLKEGDSVIVESDFGLSIGTVVREKRLVESSEREFKKVLRATTEDDLRTRNDNRKLEKDAKVFCLERIMARGLPMKLVGAEATLDRKRIIFYFTADGRIDFRELVKDLAAKFKTRIEMRQIGVRDEAKLVGGLGICGRELCCNTFLSSFDPVSIKMAKKQELVLNVGKLSGLCSRLMCCLRYEYDGDLASIAADDEIPIGAEDAPIAVIEEKIAKTLSKNERPRNHPRQDTRPRRDSGRDARPKREAGQEPRAKQEAVPADNRSEAAAGVGASPVPETAEATKPEGDGQQEKRPGHRRHRRRRFKNEPRK